MCLPAVSRWLPLLLTFPGVNNEIAIITGGYLTSIPVPVLDPLVMAMQNEVAVEILRWSHTFGKHRMNPVS